MQTRIHVHDEHPNLLGAAMLMKNGFWAAIATAALVFGAGSAQAVTLSVLPNALSYEYFGLNFASNIATSNAVGTLNYSAGPGCGGVCVATTTLGADPTVALNVNEVTFGNTSGGYAIAEMGYYVEYLNNPGTYAVDLHSGETLSTGPSAATGAVLAFGTQYSGSTGFGSYSQVLLSESGCANGCPQGVSNDAITYGAVSFAPSATINIQSNTVYFLQILNEVAAQPDGLQYSVTVDPTFSTSATGGVFVFSPGVFAPGGGVPEPGAWVLMMIGVGALGAGLRTARARAAI